MQQKLCLWMAMVVLFGALCVGNPFLACREGQTVASPTEAVPSAVNHGKANHGKAMPAEREPLAIAVAPPRVSLASDQPRIARATDAGVELASLSVRSPGALLRSSGPSAVGSPLDLECPDEALRPLVVRTELHDGVAVWVLVDGRRLRRHPKPAAGEPLLVPFVPTAADDRPE